MSNQRNVADQVRPYLQAMEESIRAARRRRLHEDEPTVAPISPGSDVAPEVHPDDLVAGDAPRRLRARPKRSSSHVASYDPSIYRSQAG